MGYFFSQLLYRRFKSNMLVNLLGQWQEADFGGQSIPVGGLAYYISPPHSLSNIWEDPIHAFIYVSFVLISCALFSKTWIEVSGSLPYPLRLFHVSSIQCAWCMNFSGHHPETWRRLFE